MTRLRPEARNCCASALRSAMQPCLPALFAGLVCRPCLPALFAGLVCRPCLPALFAGLVCRPCLPALFAGLVCRPCLPALFEGADDLREEMTLRALVEPGMAASAQFRAFEPVEHEQRAFDPPQLLECEVELVLAAVGREFSQHDGRRHDAGLQRRAPYRCGRCGCCGSAGTAALARRRRGQPPRGSRGCAPLPLPRSLLPESSAGSGASKLYRLWLKRRSSCLSPSLGAYGLQDA